MAEVKKVRKLPVEVEAMRFRGTPADRNDLDLWISDHGGIAMNWLFDGKQYSEFMVKTLEGYMVASVGDWIIRGVEGEFYPCKPQIFDQSYEVLD